MVPDKRYARHAKFFNTMLLPECGGDEALAAKVIDLFFDEKIEHTNGWSIGSLQVKYRKLLFNERQHQKWVENAMRNAKEKAVEKDERQGAVPPESSPALDTVRWLAKAKEANLKEKAL